MRTPPAGPAHDRRPFGSPEGDRSELRDPLKEFIPFRGARFRSGLGLNPKDRSVRVIVGRKGAGKTLYLRRLQDEAARENAIYADDWQTSIFRTECVVQMLDWYQDERTAVERWEEVWRCAILRSVVSHILTAPQLGAKVSAELAAECRDLCPKFTGPESIYAQVGEIIGTQQRKHEFESSLDERAWQNLARLVGKALTGAKPICFYLDALDEKFENAPRPWLICQLGLFRTVMNLLRDSRIGPRLHIVIGVRDIVFSSTQMSEHATKYLTEAIRTLGWDWPAIDYFLEHKLENLPPEYLMKPSADTAIERWLGEATIHNERRGQDEAVKRYLLRHTRLIPRDVVVLGNRLCDLIDRTKDADQPFLSDGEIRDVVHQAARSFGNEELCVIANHLTAEAVPVGAVEGGFSEGWTGDAEGGEAYPLVIAERLAEMLELLQHDRFSKSDLDELAIELDDLIDTRADVLDVLWQHGLLGYVDGELETGSVIFYSAAREDRLKLPRNRRAYALHPIMIDTIDGLRGLGQPVEPY
jgi:hypothetical protein